MVVSVIGFWIGERLRDGVGEADFVILGGGERFGMERWSRVPAGAVSIRRRWLVAGGVGGAFGHAPRESARSGSRYGAARA